ncbi:adenine nucleotide alpha hydrolase [Actinomycetospora soli]|uniref:adenine nucleotide alpha hydrolase n=1 Tax=Actinomycetospora soli TaxID=2893887 RepID=UPI001E598D8F|nr:adenine nucleotide alpha hydrolase [Actinomycetospora soli]MCD2186663.1 adenine nucleotide alpha hydrolase [Actinomycetospora soli]
MPRSFVSWSCGKDAARALHEVRTDQEVGGLLTTVTDGAVAMSRVPVACLRAQAASLGLPLRTVDLPWPCPNEVYEERTGAALAALRADGVDTVVFGDLFLDDVRAYRERSLDGAGLLPRFPLWSRRTDLLARQMLDGGTRAVVVCVDPAQAPPEIVGRAWDERLLDELPSGVDPCGENGEFHTFVTDGPGFERPVDVVPGDPYDHDGFHYVPLRLRGPSTG